MMTYYCLSFLVGEIWLDLRNNILFRDYSIFCTCGRLPIIGLWANRVGPSFRAGTKGLNVGAERPKCFNGHVSPLGFSGWEPQCFVGLTSFLGLAGGPMSLIFRTLYHYQKSPIPFQ